MSSPLCSPAAVYQMKAKRRVNVPDLMQTVSCECVCTRGYADLYIDSNIRTSRAHALTSHTIPINSYEEPVLKGLALKY